MRFVGSGGRAANLNLWVHGRRTEPFEPHARTEGCADHFVDGAGRRLDGSARGTGGQAGPAAQDARQLQRSSFERTEEVGAFDAQGQGQPTRRGASSAPPQPDLRADRVGVCLPRLRLRRFGRPTKSLRDLRPDRNPRNPARRDARDLAGRRLPVLRQTLQGPSTRRLGAGIAIWAEPSRLRDLSARGPRHSDGPVERRVEGSVRAGHQRGGAGQYSERGPRALHDADEPHQGAAAGGHGVGFGRDGPARRQGQLVALGVPPWRQRRLRGPSPPFQAGRAGLSGRMAARLLAIGSLGQPDGLGYARASVLLGPSHSGCPIRDRRRRRRVRAGVKGLFKRACAIGRRRDELADSTLKIYLGDLNRRLDRLLVLKPTHKAGRKLQETIKAIRGNLFVFMTNRDLEATNNGSERALRPCAVYRKITNGFRSEWGAKFYADIRSVVETARRRAIRAIDAIRLTLRSHPLHCAA